ncbi:MAG: Ada metal-binding domain-containing protein, partial [Candidatus Sulfotelmatobacter sp.]
MTTNAILATETFELMPSRESKAAKIDAADDLRSDNLRSDDPRWTAVVARDSGRDGEFVFAVSTTGVYCRPSCAARRPRRENVQFFAAPEAAERAGYRACLRCRPKAISGNAETDSVK